MNLFDHYTTHKMSTNLEITRSEHIDILKNRGKKISSKINDDTLLKRVKYLKKRDLIHLATIRDLVFDESSLENVLNALFKDVHKKKNVNLLYDLHKYHHKIKSKNLKEEIYRNLQKRKNDQIIKNLKRLKRLKQSSLVKRENMSQKELDEVKRLSELPINILRKLVQLRNLDSSGLKKAELLSILMRSQKHHKEKEYLNYWQTNPDNEITAKIVKIKRSVIELGMLLNKSEINNIRKRLNEIARLRPNRAHSRRLLEELTKISNDLKFKKEHINNAFDSSSYSGLKDLEYTFGDLDDYYMPILAKESFNGNYQMFTCKGDKERTMSTNEYLERIRPYLIALIDEKKTSSHKIELDIAINLIHLTKSDRITFYVKSKNIECLPSDDAEHILEQLINSLLEYFEKKLLICRIDSTYVFESIAGFSIHFHKIDLRRASS